MSKIKMSNVQFYWVVAVNCNCKLFSKYLALCQQILKPQTLNFHGTYLLGVSTFRYDPQKKLNLPASVYCCAPACDGVAPVRPYGSIICALPYCSRPLRPCSIWPIILLENFRDPLVVRHRHRQCHWSFLTVILNRCSIGKKF